MNINEISSPFSIFQVFIGIFDLSLSAVFLVFFIFQYTSLSWLQIFACSFHFLHFLTWFSCFFVFFSESKWDPILSIAFYFLSLVFDLISFFIWWFNVLNLFFYLNIGLMAISLIGLFGAYLVAFERNRKPSKPQEIQTKFEYSLRNTHLSLIWYIQIFSLIAFAAIIFLFVPTSKYFMLLGISEGFQIYIWFLIKIIIGNQQTNPPQLTTAKGSFIFVIGVIFFGIILSAISLAFRFIFIFTQWDYSIPPILLIFWIRLSQWIQLSLGVILFIILVLEIIYVQILSDQADKKEREKES